MRSKGLARPAPESQREQQANKNLVWTQLGPKRKTLALARSGVCKTRLACKSARDRNPRPKFPYAPDFFHEKIG
jgi:hypothetical protein